MPERLKQRKFLEDEFWMFAWNASVQRAGIYEAKSFVTPERQAFKSDLKKFIESKLLPQYQIRCSETKHYGNISRLVAQGSASGKNVLSSRGYGYGVAQKLLNLYLKYFWCVDYIAEPPHCPIDRIIIGKTSFRDKLNWTEMKEAEYREVIEEITILARSKGSTPARWELENYRRRERSAVAG
jgi:hypothetical protein